ncbi:MAG: REP-associated tyrosine transposase [Pyrinomonadaceae bacterium]
MAKKWTNRNLAGALHFVTGNVQNRLPIFRQEMACSAFLEECQNLKIKRECKLIAFVLMPDHIHLIVNPRDGKIREWTGALKSLSAKRLTEIAPKDGFLKNESEQQVWQESFKDLPLWSNWMIWQKINYIHNNPLKAKLVDSAKDYRWSSFRSFYKMEAEEILQVDKEWWWADDVQKLKRAMAEWDKELEEKREK